MCEGTAVSLSPFSSDSGTVRLLDQVCVLP